MSAHDLVIDEELITKVAGFSKLELTESERARFLRDFQAILDAFKVLDSCDTTGVESSFRPFEEPGLPREDRTKQCLSQEEALKFTEHKERGFFIGPRTVG